MSGFDAAAARCHSTGLTALVAGWNAARTAGGALRLARIPTQAAVILRLTGLNAVLRAAGTVEAALASD